MKHFFLVLLLVPLHLFSQRAPEKEQKKDRKGRWIYGNSWYVATSYNFCRNNEFAINVGRTNGASIDFMFPVWAHATWGAGYARTSGLNASKEYITVFREYNYWYYGARMDYLYNITDQQHYIRPSIGLSVYYVDIFYNYSFNLTDKRNYFKHGIAIRFKYFIGREKNWKYIA